MRPVSSNIIGLDLLILQLIWSLWALGIFILINIVQRVFMSSVDSFYNAGYIASNIYMFVIGIIAISFLTYYVEHGITRKKYFYGNVIASIGLSIIIPIILYILSLIEEFIINFFTAITIDKNTLDGVLTNVMTDVDGNIIAEIILSMILTPFINPGTNLFLSLALFSLNIFVFYIVGWLIGAAFQRLGVIGGILFIFIGIALITVKDSMIRLSMNIPLFENFSMLEKIPDSLSFPVILLVILITFGLIRLLTKRAVIKI